jgi:hypothetical protein
MSFLFWIGCGASFLGFLAGFGCGVWIVQRRYPPI